MVGNDTDIVHAAKSEKKSLLQRYDIPVEHLSYEYISECTNAKKLERILTILRSGEEGYYPDLTKHAEQRLTAIKPTSIILRKSEPVLKRDMLEPNECKKIDRDINDWMSEMQIREKDLEEGKTNVIDPLPQPEVRQFKEKSIKKNSSTNSQNTSKNKRIASCDYASWDKYDVDTELNKIDIREEQQLTETKKIQQKQKEITQKKKLEKDTIINKSSLTGTELDVIAEQEREKGNEAFRAGDYEEALEHYNTSIKMNSNIVAYNNRAMTYIKLRRYLNALADCNIVLNVECTNIKALLRRAVVLENLGKSSQALVDYEAVLKLEPTNTVAISGVKKLRKPCTSRKIRMTIEEEQAENIKEQLKSIETLEKRNYISQINSKLNLSNSICYCDKAPGPSQNLRPRPHIKGDYCFENDHRQTQAIKNSTTKKSGSNHCKSTSEISKSSVTTLDNRSSNISKSSQGKDISNSMAKQKSIFSVTKPKKTSSVIIEELPSEANNNNLACNQIKSNETRMTDNNSSSKIMNESKTYNDKQSNVSNGEDLNRNYEQNCNFDENNDEESLRKMEVNDKCENKTNKQEMYLPKDFSNIENGYEFMRTWRSLKNDTDLEVYAQLLRSLDVNKLNTVLGNELDGNMFSTILRCLERHFCTSKDTELVSNFLRSFSQVKRFSIVNMFLNTEDKQVIKNILDFLEEHGTSEISSLRQVYCI
ncbi:spag1 axonemal dynein assembly factor [Xylocopa sonorina]|uniref:spag1 axonemal dynein assembly factor n=1 Tax=Xylocopa sonorina TaxID=1818115 RepID=UPI00403AB1BC